MTNFVEKKFMTCIIYTVRALTIYLMPENVQF